MSGLGPDDSGFESRHSDQKEKPLNFTVVFLFGRSARSQLLGFCRGSKVRSTTEPAGEGTRSGPRVHGATAT